MPRSFNKEKEMFKKYMEIFPVFMFEVQHHDKKVMQLLKFTFVNYDIVINMISIFTKCAFNNLPNI